jgi:hypothetical protein
VAAAGGVVPSLAAAQRMSILYDDQEAVAALTGPSGPGPAIGIDRGAFRQDPGVGGLFDPRGRDAAYRIGKVSASELTGLSPEAIADRLADEIDAPEHDNASGLVAIDEIGNAFNDGRVRIRYRYEKVRGRTIRVSSYNRLVVTKTGWRLAKGRVPLPTIAPESPGAKLSDAMALLAARPYPTGGSYAERVHMYVAPAFVTSIAAGRGPHRHLGRDGKPHRATWRGVMPALARAGGVWLEMYHHSRAQGVTAFTAPEWRIVPRRFTSYSRRFRVDRSRLHFVIAGTPAPPRGASGCGSPMECQWALAGRTPAGARILANGPGAYRLGAQAGEWRAAFNRAFGGA